ncbi:unnamed protein product [Zymoseptoria tritici ST99CH_3D1]|nr:unnamed protein product [Zymoseptoria tritici ST99CH_3D1]
MPGMTTTTTSAPVDPARAAQRKAYKEKLESVPLFGVMPDDVANNGVPFAGAFVTPAGGSSPASLPPAVDTGNRNAVRRTAQPLNLEMIPAISAPPVVDHGNHNAIKRTAQHFNLEIVPASVSVEIALGSPMDFILTPPSSQQQQQSQANAAPAQATNPFASLGGQSSTQQQPISNMFGSSTTQNQAKPASNPFGNTSSNSVFGGLGGLGATAQQSSAINMFAKQPTTTQAPTAASSIFGNMNASQQAPSLLGAAQHNNLNQSQPFGRLSMGQANGAPSNTVGAVKVSLNDLRPTTRFEDCIDEVKSEMEAIDKMIQRQEQFAKELEAFLPAHEDNVNSIAPDVDFIRDKAEDVEQALSSDAQGVEAQRKNADKDVKDLERCQRIITNLSLPQGFQYNGMNSGGYGSMYGSQQRPAQRPSSNAGEDSNQYDTDLVNNYFVPKASELQGIMNMYASSLAEIESHMRVIEMSAVSQAQQLAQRRSGMNGGQSTSNETVRELADTLRGFEESILGVAGVVGESRDGVNELVLGRIGGGY